MFLPGESHGQRSLGGYSPWGCKDSDMTEATFSLISFRESSSYKVQVKPPARRILSSIVPVHISHLSICCSSQYKLLLSHKIVVPRVSSVQLLSHVQLLVTSWTAACQASLSITNSQSIPKLMSIESVMPSSCLILCHPLILLPSIFPSIRVFSNDSILHI